MESTNPAETMRPESNNNDSMELDNLKSHEDTNDHDETTQPDTEHPDTKTNNSEHATIPIGNGTPIDHSEFRKLRPFPLKITKFKNKYYRYSVHSVIFIILMLIIVVTMLSIDSIFINNKAPVFHVWPHTAPHNYIEIKSGNNGNTESLVKSMDKFLQPYQTSLPGSQCTSTSHDNYYCLLLSETDKSTCSKYNNYGYKLGTPCVAIDLAPLNNWLSDLNTTGAVVETTCVGDNSPDKEFVGPVEYFPTQGVPAQYFNSGTNPPFIFVNFKKAMLGVMFFVRCQFVYKTPANYTIYEHHATFQMAIDF